MAYCTARGATTAENTVAGILESTREMLSKIIEKNGIKISDVISIVFSCTNDLTAVYPAVAAREMGITEAGLFCTQEMFVEGSLKSCIRVMITFESDLRQSNVKHVYLKEAAKLRPDITANED